MSKSTVPRARRKDSNGKPPKPYADFPLFPHATRRWAKKIRGKLHYFGPWDDPDAALNRYLDQRDELHAGRVPLAKDDGLTVRELANHFLTAKRNLVDAGELRPRTWAEYKVTCGFVIDGFGKNRRLDDIRSADFQPLRRKLAKRFGPTALGNEVNRIRMIFKYGFDEELIDKPIRFGQSFKRPSKKTLRQHRASKGPRMFEAEQIRQLLETSNPQLRAMILLGLNCGFGNTDCGTVIALVHSLTVRVSHNEIRLSFGVGLIQKSFLIDDIEAAATARNRWYNGWGIKKIRGGWLYNVSGFDAVEIQLNSGRRYRIGTDQPRELLAAVESAMAQSG